MTLYYKAKLIGAVEPSVWRVLALPNTATYHDLHRAIQEAFDWQDYHLYEFRDALEVYHSRNEWRVQDHGMHGLGRGVSFLSGEFAHDAPH